MLLPYYIASLNIEQAYYERTGEYKPFEGICFADTLELAEGQQLPLSVEKNTERVEREKSAQIMVVIGNPPYNMGQVNENDNNKNRPYQVIDGRIRETYSKESQATLNNKLYDAYVRFFRWAIDRLQGHDGIVCFVSNNSFIDQIAFDGMRKHLLQDFTQIYHLDLHGNVRKNPKLSGTTHNVFGIQVGVGITIAVRASEAKGRALYYYRVPEFWNRLEKLSFLSQKGCITDIEWLELQPDKKHTWLTSGLHPEFVTFLPIGTKETKDAIGEDADAIFKLYSLGVVTSRDEWAYNFSRQDLTKNMQLLIRNYNSEVSRWSQEGSSTISIDDFVNNSPAFLKWTDRLKESLHKQQILRFDTNKIRISLYRPFCKQFLYFDQLLNQRRYQQHLIFPASTAELENTVIIVSDHGFRSAFSTLVASATPDLHILASTDAFQCFPYYTYSEYGSNRRENITDWALAQFQARYGADMSKGDIFSYVYAMLHHPQYRERYIENLKHDLPHIPLLHSKEVFLACKRVTFSLRRRAASRTVRAGYNEERIVATSKRPVWVARTKQMLPPASNSPATPTGSNAVLWGSTSWRRSKRLRSRKRQETVLATVKGQKMVV